MRTIGAKVSKNFMDNRKKWPEGFIIDFKNSRFIDPEELYTPDSETTLDWENLAALKKRDSCNGVYVPRPDGMLNILSELINPLAERGEFSHNEKRGFWYLIGAPAGGIKVYDGRDSDAHGRRGPTVAYLYPKREADAVAYGKYFFKDSTSTIRPALMGLAANRDWKE